MNFELAIAKISRYCKFASRTQAQRGNDPHPAPPPRHVSCPIGEIPDHATFRGNGVNTVWLDKLGLFPSLALCNKANFG